MAERLRATTGSGPLGTGTYLLDIRDNGDGTFGAAAWLLLLFVPVMPRGHWTLRAENAALEGMRLEPRCSEILAEGRRPLAVSELLSAWARAAVVLALALAPAAWTYLRIEHAGLWPAVRLMAAVLLPLYVAARLDSSLVRVTRAGAGP